MAVQKVTSSYGGSHKADNALRTIEFAIQELVAAGITPAQVLARAPHFTNDTALVTAIAAAVTAGRV